MNILVLVIATLLAAGFFGAMWSFRKYSALRTRLSKLEHEFSDQLNQKVADAEEGRRRIGAILESMTEGVMVVERDDRILLVNTALVKSFGITKKGAEGRFYWEILRDGETNRIIREALKDQAPRSEEQAISFTDSTFQIQISPIANGEDFLGVVAVFHDVTQIKQYERLRQEFVANVSHELKTPLTSIMGYIETLKEGAIEDADNRMRFLSVIEGQSIKLHRLIEDLLLLSRMESHVAPLQKQPVRLDEEIQAVLQLISRAAQEKSVHISSEISKDLVVEIEPSSFERALRNVLENAVKYNRPDGSVTVRAMKQGAEVCIRVSDTGIGISETDLPRIFERFYRADRSRSSESGGSGLGLSIAKHILERHGGRIEVESQGQGATFTLTLPA